MREAASDPGTGVEALLLVKIVNFPAVAELFGPRIAEQLREGTGGRLRPLLPRGALLAPTGGGALRVSLPDLGAVGGPAGLSDLAHALQTAAGAEPVPTAAGALAAVVAVAGVAGRPGSRDRLEAAAVEALSALPPGAGGVRVAARIAGLAATRAARQATARLALSALTDCRLSLAFQPVVQSTEPMRIAFHECLLRLRGPEGEPIDANAFLPALQAMGLAPMVDRQVLAMAIETLEAHPRCRLSVNLDPATLADESWIRMLEDAAALDPGVPERLIVELTENGATARPGQAQAMLDRLRGLGVALALDDFGAGHSGLARLARFRFDFLKLDRSLIAGLPGSRDAEALTRCAIDLARHFDMVPVAEGVETADQAAALAALGVDLLQGRHPGPPRQAPLDALPPVVLHPRRA